MPDSTSSFLSRSTAFAALPPVWPTDLLPANDTAASAVGRTLVVLDDVVFPGNVGSDTALADLVSRLRRS